MSVHESEVSGVNYGIYLYRAGGRDNEVVNNMMQMSTVFIIIFDSVSLP